MAHGQSLMRLEGINHEYSTNPRIRYGKHFKQTEGLGHQNADGLTERGKWLIDELIDRGMIIDIDHFSDRAMYQAMEKFWQKKYPGVVASHTEILDIIKGTTVPR